MSLSQSPRSARTRTLGEGGHSACPGVDHVDPLQAPQYEQALDEKRRAEVVRSLMSSLSAPQKKAIELAYFEGLSHSEIAEELHEPLGTVKSWIRNGLIRLKEGLRAQAAS